MSRGLNQRAEIEAEARAFGRRIDERLWRDPQFILEQGSLRPDNFIFLGRKRGH